MVWDCVGAPPLDLPVRHRLACYDMQFINQSAPCTSWTWAVPPPCPYFLPTRVSPVVWRVHCTEKPRRKEVHTRQAAQAGQCTKVRGYGGMAAPLRLHFTLGGLVRSTIVACTRRLPARGRSAVLYLPGTVLLSLASPFAPPPPVLVSTDTSAYC